MSSIRFLIFDLDGTLIDHSATIHRCAAAALKSLGLPIPTLAAIQKSVGSSPEVWMKQFAPRNLAPRAAAEYSRLLAQNATQGVRLLPGCRRILQNCHQRGIRLALFTNKSGPVTRAILAQQQIDRYFDVIVGLGDTPWRKPDPQLTKHVLQLLKAEPENSAIIGDSIVDIETAHDAGLPCLAVATGGHSTECLIQAGADQVYRSLTQLDSILK